MSYQIKISAQKTPAAYGAFINMIDEIRLENKNYNPNSIMNKIKKYHDIVLHPYAEGYHLAEFPSEKDFVLFMLRWS